MCLALIESKRWTFAMVGRQSVWGITIIKVRIIGIHIILVVEFCNP